MGRSEESKQQQRQYHKDTYKHINFALRKDLDKDIIDWIEKKRSEGETVNGIYRAALLRYMEKHGENS